MKLASFLNRLSKKYHRTEFLSSDPLEFVHRFKNSGDPLDQEAIAVASALLAYGNVKQIRRSVEDLLVRMGNQPAQFVRSLGPGSPKQKESAARLRGFVHRFNVGSDMYVLFHLLERSWREYGSLGAHFLKGLDPKAPDITLALNRLMEDWNTWLERTPAITSVAEFNLSFFYLLTAPEDGSACKRWCMLLRWMGRQDELDPGLWTVNSPLTKTFPKGRALKSSQLVIPLDTHTGRISQYLGLTSRKSLNWKAALEVTEALRACDPEDPTRYDFALSRLGILDLCQKTYRKEICDDCDLLPVCQFARSQSPL
jgi:uncharacterized protein (TIGR02757 family)